MTELDLSVGEELSSSFEPCLRLNRVSSYDILINEEWYTNNN